MTPAEREVIANAVKELDAEHYVFSEGVVCNECGEWWPCPSRRVADDLRRLLETPPEASELVTVPREPLEDLISYADGLRGDYDNHWLVYPDEFKESQAEFDALIAALRLETT